MKTSLIPLTAIALACSACYRQTSREIVTPDGRRGYAITCDREADCYQNAGRTCPRGYDVIRRQTTEDLWMSWSGWENNFVVQCR